MPSSAESLWPPQDIEHLGHCPACGDATRTPLHGPLTDRLFNCAPGTWQLHTCTACQSVYVDPRPTPASIGRAYASYFTHTEGASNHTRSLRLRVQESIKACLNSYRNARWQMQLAPSNTWGRWLVSLAWPLRNLLAANMRHLPPTPPHPNARLLDVGCGSGAYLEMARSAGWQVQGVDFDPVAVEVARKRGLDVRCGGLEQFTDQLGSFDRLTCSHVIEHVHNPRQWLSDMHALLRPGGILWLQTPNIASAGHQHFGMNWRGLEPPRHLTLFTPDTLACMFETVGFTVKLLPLPMLMAVPIYDASRNLAKGTRHADGFAWRSLTDLPTLWRALRQSRHIGEAEFITMEATRT